MLSTTFLDSKSEKHDTLSFVTSTNSTNLCGTSWILLYFKKKILLNFVSKTCYKYLCEVKLKIQS